MKEEIKHVMHYLYRKGWTAWSAMLDIHETYNIDYPSYSTAKRMFSNYQHPEIEHPEVERKDSPKIMERINAIQSVIDTESNVSVRSISNQTQILTTSVWRTLVSDMGLIFRYPTVAPHVLTPDLKEKRIEKCIEILRVLEDPSLQLHKIITGDESWLE